MGPRWATCVPGSPAASWDRALRRGSASPLLELGAVSLACLCFRKWLSAQANTRASIAWRCPRAAPPRPPADQLGPALKEPPPPGPPRSQALLSAGPLQWLSSPAPGSPLSLSHRALRPWGSVLVAPREGGLVQTRRGREARPEAGDSSRRLRGAFRKWDVVVSRGLPFGKRGRAEGARGRGGEGAWPWAWGRVRPGRAVTGDPGAT